MPPWASYRGGTTKGPAVTDVDGCTGLDMATVIHRDGTVALRDITLLARPGELLAVLGPSGSGKSTALRAIAGLVKTSAGRVLIAGQPTTAEPARRDIAMVFENTRLVPFLDVARNMGFGLEVRHIPKDQAAARVEHQARRLRISRLLSRKADTISAARTVRWGSDERWSAGRRRSCWTNRWRMSTPRNGLGCGG